MNTLNKIALMLLVSQLLLLTTKPADAHRIEMFNNNNIETPKGPTINNNVDASNARVSDQIQSQVEQEAMVGSVREINMPNALTRVFGHVTDI